MNSTQEQQTVTNHEFSRHLVFDQPSQMTAWRQYLGVKPDQIQLSKHHRQRLGLTDMFHELSLSNFILFHLTVTYKTYKNTPYTAKNTNDFFINFYLKCFLPELLSTRNIHKRRELQPICYSFLDEHENSPTVSRFQVAYSDRLHHHAILAVHAITVSQINPMVGENRIPLRNKWASKVMTTHLRECEPMTTLYATKQLEKYQEFLSFPDRLH